jgi:hypothetical protein
MRRREFIRLLGEARGCGIAARNETKSRTLFRCHLLALPAGRR